MSENSTESVVNTEGAAYTEGDDNFVPDPTNVFGTLDTSATAGGAHEDIEQVSPVFEAARAQDLAAAADALDDGDTSQITLPSDSAAPSDLDAADANATDRIQKAADESEGVVIEDPSQEQDPANDPSLSKDEVSANVEADQRGASAAGGTGGTGGTGSTKADAKSTTKNADKK